MEVWPPPQHTRYKATTSATLQRSYEAVPLTSEPTTTFPSFTTYLYIYLYHRSSCSAYSNQMNRKDSTETIRASDFNRPSNSKAKVKNRTVSVSVSRYSPEGLWKAARPNEFSKGDPVDGDARSSSASSTTTPPTSQPRPEGKTKRGKTHKRSNAIHGARSTTQVGEKKLSATCVAEEGRQKAASSSLGRSGGGQAIASVSKVTAQGTLVEPHQKETGNGDTTSKENDKSLKEASSKAKEGTSKMASRPPLRVRNIKPITVEQLRDIGGFDYCSESDEDSPVSVHVEDASPPRVISPSEIFGEPDSWSKPISFGNAPGSTDPRIDSDFWTKTDPTNSRLSLKVKLREEHATFWDVEERDCIEIRGELELSDLLHETCDLYTEMHVRSFVGAPIRGIEHEDEPQFTLHHYDPQHCPDSDQVKCKRKRINLNAINPDDNNGMADLPSWAKSAFQETDKRVQIKAFEWTESVYGLAPTQVKYFTIPIPATLFDYRESRIFRVEAKVSFRSKFSGGQYQHIEAPATQISVTHLHSIRELGIRTHVPARLDPLKIR